MTDERPSFLIPPALVIAAVISVVVTLPLFFPLYSIFQSNYLPCLAVSAVLGLAFGSVLFFFRALKTWKALFAFAGSVVAVHLLEEAIDRYLPEHTVACMSCTPTSNFTADVALRFLLVSVVLFAVCLSILRARPKVPWLLLISIASACLGSATLGFLDAQSQQARMDLVINGRPLWPLWQPTLALFLGLAVWVAGLLPAQNAQSLPASDTEKVQPRRLNRFFGIYVALAIIVAILAWGAWGAYRQNKAALDAIARSKAQIALSVKQAPPMASLLVDKAMKPTDFMVTENLGDWKIYYSGTQHLDAVLGQDAVFPERQIYTAYFGRGNPYDRLVVEITQYPSEDWARYELRNTPMANALYDILTDRQRLSRLGGRVFQDGTEVFWSSGDKIVSLDCEGVHPRDIDIFARAYLKKYPSSVPPAQ